jgi:hypothetical protein
MREFADFARRRRAFQFAERPGPGPVTHAI